MCLNALRSLLQFTTILPLGAGADFDSFAKRSYLYPLAGYVIGGIAAVPAFFITDQYVAAAVAIAAVLILSGFHHFDGLLDLGDGLMANGTREKRISALTDRNVGAGAVGTGITVVLLTYAGLLAAHPVAWAIIVAEVGGKFAMTVLTVTGAPFREGIHSYLHARARPAFILFAAVLCIPLGLLPFSPVQFTAAATVMVACPLILLVLSNRLFGGVNGDIAGASNEITRAAVVLALALA